MFGIDRFLQKEKKGRAAGTHSTRRDDWSACRSTARGSARFSRGVTYGGLYGPHVNLMHFHSQVFLSLNDATAASRNLSTEKL